jgi:carbon monoxide dehydrogenase subunit G
MKVSKSVYINSTKEKVWKVISDIENSSDIISGINKIEIVNKPKDGLIGLKWKETRTIFGKEATETMWITDSVENEYYKTRAESHGMIYISELKISEEGGKTKLTMNFYGETTNFFGKIMSFIFSKMMNKSTEKMILEDLNDIKNYIEENN